MDCTPASSTSAFPALSQTTNETGTIKSARFDDVTALIGCQSNKLAEKIPKVSQLNIKTREKKSVSSRIMFSFHKVALFFTRRTFKTIIFASCLLITIIKSSGWGYLFTYAADLDM